MALTTKQRVFVEEYLTCWNATEAARRAGYKHPGVQCSRLLADVRIKSEIEARLKAKHLTSEEVLTRLGEQARAEQNQYIDKSGKVNLEAIIADGKQHLIRGIHWDAHGHMIIDFYDAQRALEQVGRALGVFAKSSPGSSADNPLVVVTIGGANDV